MTADVWVWVCEMDERCKAIACVNAGGVHLLSNFYCSLMDFMFESGY